MATDTKLINVAVSTETIAQITRTDKLGRQTRKYAIPHCLCGVCTVTNRLNEVTSVTSIIGGTLKSGGLDGWRKKWMDTKFQELQGAEINHNTQQEIYNASSLEADRSANLGTEVHLIIEKLLRGEDVNYGVNSDQLEPAVRAWLKWRHLHTEWQFIGAEVGIYDSHLKYAGQVDAVFKSGNDYMVVDWKTSSDGPRGSGIHVDNYLQIGAYAGTLRSMLGRMHAMGEIPKPRVFGCVVRLCNNYPNKPARAENYSYRYEDKVFSGNVEYADVPVTEWYKNFKTVLYTYQITKKRLDTITI